MSKAEASSGASSVGILWAIAANDALLLLRDRAGLFFTLIFPLIIAVFFGTAFSGAGETARLPLAVVDEDQSSASQAWIEALAQNEALEIRPLPQQQAWEQLRKGKVTAVLVIPEGFSTALEQLFDPLVPRVQLSVSPGDKAAAGLLEGVLMAQAVEDMHSRWRDVDGLMHQVDASIQSLDDAVATAPEALRQFMRALRDMLIALQQAQDSGALNHSVAGDKADQDDGFSGLVPLQIDRIEAQGKAQGAPNSYAISFPQGVVWGILGIVSAFSLSLVSEARQGTLVRLLSMPVSRRQILGGKALGCFLTQVVVMTLLMTVGILFFDIDIQRPVVLILAILASALGFTGLMMLLAVLGKTEKSASGLTWAVLMIMAMTGGGMIPLFAMPGWMAALGQFSPVQWTVMAFEGALWRHFSVLEALPYLVKLVLLGVAGFVLGSYRFQRKVLH